MGAGRRARWLARVALVGALAGAHLPASAAAGPPRDVAGFACPPGLVSPFTDVDGSVHAAAIRCLDAYGVTKGTTATAFSPARVVTRGQMASFVARALAFSGVTSEPGDSGFSDVAGSPHAPAIEVLARFGVVQGTTAASYAPGAPVSRAQAATLLARAIELGTVLPANPPDAFVDDEAATAHERSINALAALGIIGGVTADRFAPRAQVTRAAMASLVARTIDFMIESSTARPLQHVAALAADLRGAEQVPGPGDAGAQVTARFERSTTPGMLCVTWDVDGPLTEGATGAHVRAGAAGLTGPVLFALPTPGTPGGERGWERSCIDGIHEDQIEQVFADPHRHHVEIRTAAFPEGAVRGQLSPLATLLGTTLSGDEEGPPGEVDAGGVAFVDLLEDGTTVCASIDYVGAAVPTAAHVHAAEAGADGPVVVTLAPFDGDEAVADGCVGGLDPRLVADIAADPAGYYVDVHTDAYPDGAVRGRLAVSVQLEAPLTGAAAAPGAGDPHGAGHVYLDLVGDGHICVQLEVRGTDTPVAAHLHEGASGAHGPVIVPLPTPTFNAVRTCIDVPPGRSDQLAASPSDFSVDVHTAALPDGALRGQLVVDPP